MNQRSPRSERGSARPRRFVALIALAGLCASTAPVSAAGELNPTEVKTGYRQILGVLATGDLERAVAELVEFEQGVVGDAEEAWRYVERFWRLKLKVIRDLLESQGVEVLMPITLLHHDAYLEYSKLGLRHIAQHSRQMASELAEVYAQQTDTQGGQQFSGWVLTSIAANLWSPIAMSGGAEHFYRSYLVDPGNQVTLLGLAAAHEAGGHYEKAIEYLRQALRLEPDDSETRLRMALCLIRFEPEPPAAAVAALTELTGETYPTWIRSVAYQELARLWIQADRQNEADSLLRQGLGELAGDQQLSLLLAAMLDRQRQRDEAIGKLDAIPADGWDQDSPRLRYAGWEPAGIEKVRDDLREEMKEGLPPLEAGLRLAASEEAGE